MLTVSLPNWSRTAFSRGMRRSVAGGVVRTGHAPTRFTARPLRAVKDLDWRDRLEVARILYLAAAVEAGLRLLPLPRLARLLRVELELHSTELGVPMTVRPPEWAVRRIL